MNAEPVTTPNAWTGHGFSRCRRMLLALPALVLGTVLWLPVVHFLYMPNLDDFRPADATAPLPPCAQALAERHLNLWENPALRQQELLRMRGSNAEWDFMGRTFLILALANMSLREPTSAERYLAVMDQIIDDTEAAVRKAGQEHFLMDYARTGAYRAGDGKSIFVDGEIALMMAVRRMVNEKEAYREPLQRRITALIAQLRQSPVLCGESYPDECWTFCNTVAVCAIKIQGLLDQVDHRTFVAEWLDTAKRRLVHPESGLLISSLTQNGEWLDGPEGSSIWMVAHNLKMLDPEFARDQYQRARTQLCSRFIGFTYAREWPASWPNRADIDSGPIIPWLDASAGSSGTAFIAAGAFDDQALFAGLLTSLTFAGFPEKDASGLRYHASNQVGDAVLLYSLVQGPLLNRIREREAVQAITLEVAGETSCQRSAR